MPSQKSISLSMISSVYDIFHPYLKAVSTTLLSFSASYYPCSMRHSFKSTSPTSTYCHIPYSRPPYHLLYFHIGLIEVIGVSLSLFFTLFLYRKLLLQHYWRFATCFFCYISCSLLFSCVALKVTYGYGDLLSFRFRLFPLCSNTSKWDPLFFPSHH
ncbi:hypothetical protein L873DRAFT_855294 [Choiromyces venosus 120613-1]|uniref:Uncharacterized protein n=1 Tax=Choiromyces venosus 120613-1 TaxID=1336337 RepID=A0A3N4JP51_9PEZI|nr:hypothetical protein L873DRAFT_855294 [Choiromyces venosus 120613-1]